MAIALTCSCGTSYQLKDELGGTLVQCPKCRANVRVPGGAPGGPPPPGVDPVFHRNAFYLRQKLFSISERYAVWDETGREILYIVRPARILAGVGALLLAIALAAAVFLAFYVAAEKFVEWASLFWFLLAGGLASAVVFGLTLARWLPLKNVQITRDQEGGELLLLVDQDQRLAPITATYTVRLPDGTELARFEKNIVYNLVRSRWYVYRPDGTLWVVAKEDSLLLAMLRRLLGHLYGALRKHFVIQVPETEQTIGEFQRQFSMLDRYFLDLSEDGGLVLDRRVALALAVMLDTGEGR